MALIVIAADKGAPGVTTTALALAAVWPRPVLLAECDPAGGDLAFRFPGADGERLDSRRGMLSLAVAARRGLQPGQVWEHTQKLHGGIDVLVGVTNADQGTGLSMFWGQFGRALAAVPQVDVIADCGRLGTDGPATDLLAEASAVLLLTRPEVGEVVRLRDRVVALAAAIEKRGRRGFVADVAVIADLKNLQTALAELAQVMHQGRAPARMIGGIAADPRAAGLLRGQWGGKLDKSLLIRSVREIAGRLAAALPGQPATPAQPPMQAQPDGPPAAGYGPRHGADPRQGVDPRQGTNPQPAYTPSAGQHRRPGYEPPAENRGR